MLQNLLLALLVALSWVSVAQGYTPTRLLRVKHGARPGKHLGEVALMNGNDLYSQHHPYEYGPMKHDPLAEKNLKRFLASVPLPPVSDQMAVDAGARSNKGAGIEGDLMRDVVAKMNNRRGWLKVQKQWLAKASDAASVIERAIQRADASRSVILADLADLRRVHDFQSTKYKIQLLKHSYHDKAYSLEKVDEELADIHDHQVKSYLAMKKAKDLYDSLSKKAGPNIAILAELPAQDLEDPLAFLRKFKVDESPEQENARLEKEIDA